ncbi:MAG: DMT family transporter [Lautropia sp.]
MADVSRTALARLLLYLIPALWSTNYVGARAAAGAIGAHQLALARWSIAFLLMLPFAWPELRARWPQWRGEWPRLLVLGALGMWICGAFVYVAAETTLAINIGLIYAFAPVLIGVASVWMLGERLERRQLAGAALSLLGVTVILFKGSPAALRAFALTPGDLWIGIAVLSWSGFSILQRRWPSALGPFARTVAVTGAGILVLIPFTLAETASIGLPRPSLHLAGLVLVVAVLPGVVAYQAYAFVQREFGAARTAVVLYLGPLYSGLIAWVLLAETPGLHHALGAALILPGLRLATGVRRAR